MKKLTGIAAAALMAATVGGGLAVPTAASAQVTIRFGEPRYWTPERTGAIRNQIWQLDNAVDRAERRRTINNREARQLHRQVRNLEYTYNRYARNGLNFAEVRALQNQVNRVRQQLRMDRLDWDREDYWRGNRWRDHDRDNDGVPNRFDRHDNNPRRH
jgi:hypothetical protein